MIGRLLLAALLAVSAASAQRGGGNRGAMNADGTPMNLGAGFATPRQTKLDAISKQLKLNKEQKAEVEAILYAARPEALPLREALSKGREAIAVALLEGKAADAEQAEGAYAALAAKMTGIETSAFAKIYATLKPNQQSRASQAFEAMNGMFLASGRDRGR
jgi:Spy/CpxP family protein refolding chaperone